ncbi:MAG: TetR/AcrR family transcriptional regulator [Rhodospirillaceae bacterium]|nr:TetR/AcrR family transcriptional regulator [Rhodospirillaceae bacterium]
MPEPTETVHSTLRREKRRRAILDAAQVIFLEKGYERATLTEVLARSGGSRSTLAELFGGKEGLFIEVLRESSHRIEVIFDALEACDAPPDVALKDFARRFLDVILDSRTIAVLRTMIAEGFRFPEIASAFFQLGPDVGDKKLGAYFQHCIDRGVLRSFDPLEMSRVFRGMIIGDHAMRASIGVQQPEDMAAITAQIDTAVSIFLSGVSPTPLSSSLI